MFDFTRTLLKLSRNPGDGRAFAQHRDVRFEGAQHCKLGPAPWASLQMRMALRSILERFKFFNRKTLRLALQGLAHIGTI
jgi:hypothetical protein